MAQKSRSQRARAAAARQNRKDRAIRDQKAAERAAEHAPEESASKGASKLFSKKEKAETQDKQPVKAAKTPEKPKKEHFKFWKDVRVEMKRVTWPTRQDVLRWSGVVVFALIFFGLYVALLDNVIITPLLVSVTSLGA